MLESTKNEARESGLILLGSYREHPTWQEDAPIVARLAVNTIGKRMTNKVFTFVGNELSPLELFKKLKSDRGLTDADIDRLGITVVAATETKDALGWAEANPLIKIPYFGITGEKLADNRGNQLARYRRTVLNSKGERYTQRAGTGARHYLPLGIDWVNVSRDPSIPLYYTEGEFKSITASKYLGPTIGNAGVTSFRGEQGLAKPLDDFEFRGRVVYIVYDAESSSTSAVPLKSNIVRAQGELAFELKLRGATVHQLLIAKTPHFVEGVKMGVDDYFLTTVDVPHERLVADLLATACDPEIDKELDHMFETYAVFVGTKAHIKNIKDGHVHAPKEFADLIVTNTRRIEGKPVKLATIYREHPDRNTFDEYVFDPSLNSGYLKSHGKFNLWQGFTIQPAQSVDYDTNTQNYLQFQRGVWGERYFDYFLDWASHLLQRPAERTSISPILVSRVKGVGKSLTGDVLRNIIGVQSSFIGSVDGLTEKHTGELEGKLFVQVDEADALFDSKENRLKALDSPEIRIRKMNTDGYTIKNIMRKFYTTNENAAFRIAEDERRYFVCRVDKGHEDGLEDSEWSIFLRTVIGPASMDPVWLADVMWFLMLRDIGHWDPMAPVPKTEAMMDMVEAGESKKNTMANELYAALNTMGVWAVDTSMTAVDKKLWGEIKAMLKDNKGVVATHVYNMNGAKRIHVWMNAASMLKTTTDSVTGVKLVGGQLSGEGCMNLLLKTRAKMEGVMRLVDSSKF